METKKVKDYTMKLRDYQKPMFAAAINAINEGVNRTSYYAATGSGKTVVFQAIIQHLFNTKTNAKVLVTHPRIALSLDQQSRFAQMFDVPFTSFHSGEVKQSTTRNSVVNITNKSTTNRDALVEILNEQAGNNHIVFTSYKSMNKIADMDWDLVICDEAHYLVSKEYRQILNTLTSQTMFFTATPITSKMGFSMSDITSFGEVVATVSPADLIEQGFMVAPRMIQAKITTDQTGDFEDFAESIAHAFVNQRDLLSKEIPHKMLVALPDTQQFDKIMERVADIRSITGQDVDVYYIKAGMNKRNGNIIREREETLKQFAQSPTPSIVIHCDTLAEGIDIDGLTGAYIARGLSNAKFIQTIGRCVRPLNQDFASNGMPKLLKDRIKQYAIVSVAVIDGEMRGGSELMDWYDALFEAGYPEVKAILSGADMFTGGQINFDTDFYAKIESQILDREFEAHENEYISKFFS